MRYAEFQPSAPLRPYLHCYWELTGVAGPAETILPDGRTELVFHFAAPFLRDDAAQPRAMFVGQMTRPTTVRADGPVGCFGVRFEPAGAWALLGQRQTEFTNEMVLAANVLGSQTERRLLCAGATAERIAIIEDALLKYLPGLAPAWCAAASRVLNGSLTIAEFRDGTGVGVRQFERLFEARVGLTPRTFGRLARFRRALQCRGSWVEIADACGYYDQSHLIRDFNEFSGGPPSQLRQDPLMMSQTSNTAKQGSV